MKTLKKSIFVAFLTIGSITIAQAQESNRKGWDGTVKGNGTSMTNESVSIQKEKRKGWDGTVKGKQSQGVDFGQKTSEGLNSETTVLATKKTNNKNGELITGTVEAVSETENSENQIVEKLKVTSTTSKKEFKGHVTLLK